MAAGASFGVTSVDVIVPWLDSGCEHRRRALSFCVWWWRQHHPDWRVIVGELAEGPWSKGDAVGGALTQSTADVLVIADGDSLVANAADAVRRIERGAPWVVPHERAHYLTETATARVVETGDLTLGPCARRPYESCRGGGVVVIPRDAYVEAGGFDPRFRGHGHEDMCFGWAAKLLVGEAERLNAPLVHLWHPPAKPGGRLREPGLIDRYRRARRDPDAMRTLTEPNRATLRGIAGDTWGHVGDTPHRENGSKPLRPRQDSNLRPSD